MKTVLLDNSTWDWVLDANGDIAVADEPYALAQDAASAIRTFHGDCYYDTTQGIPYFGTILGQFPPAQVMKAEMVKAALTVPGVVSAAAFLRAGNARQITGQVQITDAGGTTVAVSTPTPTPITPSGGRLDWSDPDQSGLMPAL